MLTKFLPRFREYPRERDAALGEARLAFFFHRNNFRIVSWFPPGRGSHEGDLEIQWTDTEPIFVEVKGPTWEGELSAEERDTGRKVQPKYIDGQARSVRPSVEVRNALRKALPKLSQERANLVAIVDDLFLSPLDHYHAAFVADVDAELAASECRVSWEVCCYSTRSAGRKQEPSSIGSDSSLIP